MSWKARTLSSFGRITIVSELYWHQRDIRVNTQKEPLFQNLTIWKIHTLSMPERRKTAIILFLTVGVCFLSEPKPTPWKMQQNGHINCSRKKRMKPFSIGKI